MQVDAICPLPHVIRCVHDCSSIFHPSAFPPSLSSLQMAAATNSTSTATSAAGSAATAAASAPAVDQSPQSTLAGQALTQVLSLSKVVGGQLSAHPPLFTADSAHFLCIASSSIKLFSVRTGQQIRVLSPPDHPQSHTANITALALSPKNPLQLYSASVDGSIRLWDINDGALLKVWKFGVPISHFKIHPKVPSLAFMVTTKSSGKSAEKINSVLYLIDLSSSTYSRILKARYCSAFDVSADGTSLVLAARFKLHVGTLTSSLPSSTPASSSVVDASAMADGVTKPADKPHLIYEWVQHMNDRKILALATHPTEPKVATGDESGKIKLWSVLGDNAVAQGQEPIVQTFHWHARRVNHFAFTHDGRHLLSGGDEAVLVIWQLETGQKQFISQLVSEILSITVSPDMSLFALAQFDNSIRIVSAVNLAVQQSVVGLKSTAISSTQLATASTGPNATPADSSASGAASATSATSVSPDAFTRSLYDPTANDDSDLSSLRSLLTVEPRNGYIALEGTPGTVQFYNLHADCHVMDLSVVPYNYVAGDGVVAPKVTRLAFDPTGTWMVTVDEKQAAHRERKCTLRIWMYVPSQQRWELNTRVDGLPKITAAAFRPAPPTSGSSSSSSTPRAPLQLATTQEDGRFSIWELIGVKLGGVEHRTVDQWRCRASAYYRSHAPRAVAWAADGSVLAVAFADLVTLWDPESLVLAGVLTGPGRKPVSMVAMGSAGCPYLVGMSTSHITVWNLLTLEVAWTYAVPKGLGIQAFSVCSKRDQIVIVTRDNVSAATSAAASGADSGVEADENVIAPPIKSQLAVFNMSSPIPTSIQIVHEDILSVVFTPPASETAALDSNTELVYLTRDHNLKVLSAPKAVSASSATATPFISAPAAADAGVVTATAPRTSVFIRRPKPAISDTTDVVEAVPEAGSLASNALSGMRPALSALLEAPAHAIPSVEAVFETLLGGLLELNVNQE
ncbi:WD40-repeat-containing domain protein [Catenaria anguillulae PL171]|uniref:WD40-repeat-containing domain protein n=1 Tax=Catenaria anguillulae PL171 TaxID=765915 RepID=A0A1Y2HD05_9FUNG|nr:WD40-repeat-containing domain protein [Catenaria anguillulae PL171]